MQASEMKEKADFRKVAIERRDAISAAERREKDLAICTRLFASTAYSSARTVMLYASFRSEVGTNAILEHALNNKKRTVLPLVNRDERTLELYEVRDEGDLVAGYMGIPEPGPDTMKADVDSIDLILVPGVAFDTRCGRLGYGGGYYDRLIGDMGTVPYLTALAYEEQVVDRLPLESHDIRMDRVLTESREIACS